MENTPEVLTLGQLKEKIAQLESAGCDDMTKVFIDTGWDSVQEVSPDAISIEEVQKFTIEDPLTKEVFGGYSLLEKAEKMKAEGLVEKALIIRNLY